VSQGRWDSMDSQTLLMTLELDTRTTMIVALNQSRCDRVLLNAALTSPE
jgi:hypothetical protein